MLIYTTVPLVTIRPSWRLLSSRPCRCPCTCSTASATHIACAGRARDHNIICTFTTTGTYLVPKQGFCLELGADSHKSAKIGGSKRHKPSRSRLLLAAFNGIRSISFFVLGTAWKSNALEVPKSFNMGGRCRSLWALCLKSPLQFQQCP